MNRDEATKLEIDFGVTFPVAYREAITDGYPFADTVEELDADAESLRSSNKGCRNDAPWGFPWKLQYWCIGGDGAGGFYFIDTLQDDSTVYYCDHEDMPDSINDPDRISGISFQEFIENVRQLEEDFENWERQMCERVANRKWWQFWVPREWPPKPKGITRKALTSRRAR